MRYWIVWSLKHIEGVYTNESLALEKINKLNNIKYIRKKDIIVTNNMMLESYDLDLEYHCTKINADKGLTRIYFIFITELGGAESYGNGEHWIHICCDKKNAICFAEEYFDNEHDRNNECDECGKHKRCKKKMIVSLKKENSAEIDCIGNNSCPYTNFIIFRVPLTNE